MLIPMLRGVDTKMTVYVRTFQTASVTVELASDGHAELQRTNIAGARLSMPRVKRVPNQRMLRILAPPLPKYCIVAGYTCNPQLLLFLDNVQSNPMHVCKIAALCPAGVGDSQRCSVH